MIEKDMIETDEFIAFPNKIMFRAMTQQFERGIRMRKSEHEVKNAKFVEDVIPLVNDHDKTQIIGYAENFKYNTKDKAWYGDVMFEKKHLTEDQLQQIHTLAKRDLSIEYEYSFKKNSDEQFKKSGILGDQTKLLIHNIAWVDSGRCSWPKCGLDTKNLLTSIDSQEPTRLFLTEHYKNILGKKEINMTDCDHKELKEKLAEQTAEIKTLTDSLEKYKEDNEKFVAEQKDTLISLITEKTGKDAKHYKDKSNELLLELLEELKDIKKDGYPDGTNIDKDEKDIDMSILPGSGKPFSLEQFKPTKPTEETFKLVRVTE